MTKEEMIHDHDKKFAGSKGATAREERLAAILGILVGTGTAVLFTFALHVLHHG